MEFLHPRPGGESAGVTYWDGYKFDVYADDVVRSEYERRYESLIGPLEASYGPFRSVLDIGCGIGNFLEWAGRGNRRRAVGLDVAEDAVEVARGRGLEAMLPEELAEQCPPHEFDLVTLWDVIEHVDDPRAMLRMATRFLRPGGIVLIETPDVEFVVRPLVLGIRRVVEPIRWSDMLYYFDHRTYFSARGLTTLMARCDLEIVDQQGLRSPSSKMVRIFDVWADRGSGAGALGPALYRVLDSSMRVLGVTNKLVVAGQYVPAQRDADWQVDEVTAIT
jgi:2-polyprenyl-3-methyl-5-hydroxy-6-metoxy-1,4-benzoquinol methylase